MNEKEHALTVLMEECSEVQKAITKALRFGLTHYWEAEGKLNKEAIEDELRDVLFMMNRCFELGLIEHPDNLEPSAKFEKSQKFERTLAMSRRIGTVSP